MQEISKTTFKANALKIFRDIEKTGEAKIITDHGKPMLEVRKLRQQQTNPLDVLKNTVAEYHDPEQPVAEDNRENV